MSGNEYKIKFVFILKKKEKTSADKLFRQKT